MKELQIDLAKISQTHETKTQMNSPHGVILSQNSVILSPPEAGEGTFRDSSAAPQNDSWFSIIFIHKNLAFAGVFVFFIAILFGISSQVATAAVTVDGGLTYGDTTNAGALKIRDVTGSDTFGTEFSESAAGSASGIAFVVSKAAPTRDEFMIGEVKVDGRLDVHSCAGGCDAQGDITDQFNKTVSAAMTCDAVTFGSCTRPFDIAYEQMSGDAMVAFIDTSSDGTIKYCTWNGTAWSPSTCGTPNSYSFNGGSSVDAKWVRLVPYQEGFRTLRNDYILMIVGDANNDIFAAIWDGSAWGNLTTITTGSSTPHILNFDGAWETATGDAMVIWAEGTGTSTQPFRYKKWDLGTTTWDGSGTSLPAMAGTNVGHWVEAIGAPVATKNHIAIMTSSATSVGNTCSTGSNCDGVPFIWDGSSMTKGTEWASLESQFQKTISVAMESINTDVQAVYVASLQSTSDETGYETWVEGSGFSGGNTDNLAGTTTDMADDADGNIARGNPNTNDVIIIGRNIDDGIQQHRWDGSATKAAGWSAALESAIAPGAVTANANGPEGQAFDLVLRPYSPWSRNWRFYDGADTAATPTTALANENTAPSGFDATSGTARLRFSMQELSALAQTDARKKLQYTTDTPDSLTASWTDVDNVGGAGIWRYVDCDGGSGTCDDNGTLAGTVLSGSPTAGWWTASKDAAAGANMDHGASQLRELEFSIQANGATGGSTYYFRMYDVSLNSPVFREQDNDGSNDCATATCTYPSIGVVVPTITISGSCDAYDQTTDCTDDGSNSIKVAVNGSLQAQSDATVDGAWSITGVPKPTTGAVITVFVDGASDTNEAVAVTKYDGSGNIDNVVLIKETLTLGTNGGANSPQTITNTDLEQYDNEASADEDVFYESDTVAYTCDGTASTTGLCVDNTAQSTAGKLLVVTGNTFAPGGNINTHDIEIDGTFTGGASTYTVNGSWNDTGTFTPNSSTVNFTSTSTGETITTTGSTFSNLTFNGSGGGWTLQDSTTVSSVLTIAVGNFNAGSGTTLTLSGTGGNPFQNSATFTAGTSTVSYTGANGGGDTIVENTTFYNLTVNAADTFDLSGATVVTNNLNIAHASAILDTVSGQNYALTVGGNFSNSGTFTAQAGTVTFNDNTKVSQISGSISFYNLTVTTAGKDLEFTNAQTFTIEGVLTLTGTAGGGNEVTLNRIGGSGQWTINNTALDSSSITYTTVTNSACQAGTPSIDMSGAGNTNGGNNGACWGFVTLIDFGGTVYNDQGSTNIGANKTVTLKVNGSGNYTDETDSSGIYSISAAAGSGAVVTVFIEGETENATTVTISNGSNVSGLNLYRDTLIVRYETGSSITNTHLDQYDDGNDPGSGDVVFDVTSGNLTVQNSSKLIVWTGKTFAPGGTVTTTTSSNAATVAGDLDIQASAVLNMGSNALTIGGDFTHNGTTGLTLSAGQDTTFTATAASHVISVGSTNPAVFEDVIFNGSGGGWSFSQSSNSINGDLTMTAGTLATANSITVSGGDVTGNGDINITGGTFTVSGAGNFGGDTAWDFNNLTFSGGSQTTTGTGSAAGTITVAGVLTISSSHTLAAGSNKVWILSGTGTPFVATGVFTASSGSAVRYTGNGATIASSSNGGTSITYYNLDAMPAGSSHQVLGTAAGHTINITSSFYVGDGTNSGGATGDANDPTMNIGNFVIVNLSTFITGSGTISCSRSTQPIFRVGTFTASTGNTVAITSTTGVGTLDSGSGWTGSNAFYNLTIDGDGGGDDFVTSSAITVTNDFTVSAGDDFLSAHNIIVNGVVGGTGTITHTANTFTHSTTTSKNFGSDTGWTFNNLTLSGASGTTAATGTGSVTVTDALYINPSHTLNAGSKTWILTGANSYGRDADAVLTPSTSTFSYRNTAGHEVKADIYHNLEFLPASGTPTYTVTGGNFVVGGNLTVGGAGNAIVDVNSEIQSPAVDINGSVSIGSGDTLIGPAIGMTVGGSWTNSGTFTHSSGTVTFDGTGTNNITSGGVNGKFNNIIFNNAGDTWSMQDNMSVVGVMTVTAGNLDANATTITLEGSGTPFVNSDTFTHDTSTVNYTGTSATNIAALNGASTTNAYYNLGLGTTSDSSSVTYTSGGNTTVNNQVTVSHSGSTGTDTLALSSHTWTLKGTSTPLDIVSGKGALSAGTSTVQFTSGSGVNTFTGFALTGSNAFYNLTINGTGTFTPFVNIEAKNDLTVTSGTFAMASNILTVGNSSNSNSGSIKVASGQSLTQSSGASTTILSSASGSNCIGSNGSSCSGTAGTITLGALNIGNGSVAQTTTFGGTSPSMTVADVFTILASAVFDASSGTITLSGTGTPFVKTGSFSGGSSTINYTGAGATNITAATYNNLGVQPGANSATHTLASGTFTVGGTLTVGNGSNTSVIVTAATNNNIIDLNGTSTSVDIKANTTFTAPASASFTVAGSWANAGTFTHNSGTVTFDATGTGKTIQSNGSQFNNITFNGSGGGWSPSDAMTLAGDMTMTAGTLSGTQNVTVNGGDVTGDGDINITGGTFTLAGTGNFGGATAWDFNNLTFGAGSSGTTTKIGSGGVYLSTTTGVLTVSTNHTLDAGSSAWGLYATSGTPMVRNGTFTANLSAVYFGYNGGSVNLPAAAMTGSNAFYILSIGLSGSPTVTAQAAVTASYILSLRGSLDMSTNNLIVGNTSTAHANSPFSGIGANSFSQNSANSTTILLPNGLTRCIGGAGSACTTGSPSGTWTFGDLIIGDATNTFTLNIGTNALTYAMDTLEVKANATLGAGPATTLNITGNGTALTNSGTFNAQTSTINFNSAATSGTTIPALTYYNLGMNRASNTFTAAGAINVDKDFILTAGTFTAPAGNLTIKGDFNNSGTFTHNSGTVIIDPQFNSDTSTIGGSSNTTFNNFSNTNDLTTLQFANGRTYTFGGTLTLTGSSGKPVRIFSNSQGSQWFIDLEGTANLLYVAVRDAGCSSSANISTQTKVFNLGNNDLSCWKFIKRGDIGGSSGGGAGGGGAGGGGGAQGGGSGQATATATLQTGSINSVNMGNTGSGYFVVPLVCFSGGSPSVTGTGTAVISGGSVTSITINNAGSGYQSTPTVVIGAPGTSGGSCGSGGGGGGSGGGGGGSP
jgi:hypothetical protein